MFDCLVEVWVIEQYAMMISVIVRSATVVIYASSYTHKTNNQHNI